MTETTDNPAPEVEVSTEPATEPEIVTNEVGAEPEAEVEDQSTATPEGDNAEETEEPDEGRMLKADYTRKTQELAEVRKALSERTQKLDQYVTQGEALVNVLAQEFQRDFQGINWSELAANDPAAYVQKRHAFDERQRNLQLAVGQLNAVRAQQDALGKEETQQRLIEEQRKLLDKVPDWKDAKKAAAESAELREYLTGLGYESDEVNGVTDHRAVILARKAMLYDRMQAKLPKAKPQTTAPPPPPPAPSKGKVAPSLETMSMREFMAVRNKSERRA